MAYKFPLASHLTAEEVHYELFIRGKIDDISDDDEANRCLLRRLFFRDAQAGQEYVSPYTIEQEYDHISFMIGELRGELGEGLDERPISRLRHYWRRVESIWTDDSGSACRRQELLDEIRLELSRVEARRNFVGNYRDLPTQKASYPSDRERTLEDTVHELKRQLEDLQSRRISQAGNIARIDEQSNTCGSGTCLPNQVELSSSDQLPSECLGQVAEYNDLADAETEAIVKYELEPDSFGSDEAITVTGCLEQDLDLLVTEAVAIEVDESEVNRDSSCEFLGDTNEQDVATLRTASVHGYIYDPITNGIDLKDSLRQVVDEERVFKEEVEEQQEASSRKHSEDFKARVQNSTDLLYNWSAFLAPLDKSVVANRTEDCQYRDTSLVEDPPPNLEQQQFVNIHHKSHSHWPVEFVRKSAHRNLANLDKCDGFLTLLARNFVPTFVKWKVGSRCFEAKGSEGEATRIFCWKFRRKAL